MTDHGRLLSIKEIMVSLLDSEDFLDTKFLGLFQLKDFCTNNVTRAEKARDNIYGLNFESHEIVPAIELRQANMVFPNCLLIKEGGLVIEKEILETIK